MSDGAQMPSHTARPTLHQVVVDLDDLHDLDVPVAVNEFHQERTDVRQAADGPFERVARGHHDSLTEDDGCHQDSFAHVSTMVVPTLTLLPGRWDCLVTVQFSGSSTVLSQGSCGPACSW